MHVLDACQKLVGVLFDRGYRPELHYMRGAGPKWFEKHGSLPIPTGYPGTYPTEAPRSQTGRVQPCDRKAT